MCSRVQCERCGKPSFVGCGMHVEQVLRDVPQGQRCQCREQARAAQAAPPEKRRSWLEKLLG